MLKNLGNKITAIALVVIMALGSIYGFSVTEANASPVIRVTIDGRQVHFPDQQPVNIDGRILVPIRGVFEELGYNVSWSPIGQTGIFFGNGGRYFGGVERDLALIIIHDHRTILVPIGYSAFRTVNIFDFGTPYDYIQRSNRPLDVPAQIINDRTMIPLRAVVEAIGSGYAVAWDGPNNTVLVTTPASGTTTPASGTANTDATQPSVSAPVPDPIPDAPRSWNHETTWAWNHVIVRVNGVVTNIPIPRHSQTSRLYLPIAPVLSALNLPANHVQPTSSPYMRQHIMAELLNVDIVFDMYYRTVDITSNSQSSGLSRILPVQHIPRYGWVRMTDEMLRDVERMIGETVVSQIAAEGVSVVFCPYLSAGNRRFAYDYVNRPELSLFTHTHRAGTGSNYLARGFYGSLYRPGIISQQGVMPFRQAFVLSTDLFHQAESGGLAPDWTTTGAFRDINAARAESQALQANPHHTDPYRFLGIGRHFCERTGDFFNGNFQVGDFRWRTFTRNGVVVEHYRLYTFFQNGYEVRYRDWHGNRTVDSRTRIAQNSSRAQTGCQYLNGFRTMERIMSIRAGAGTQQPSAQPPVQQPVTPQETPPSQQPTTPPVTPPAQQPTTPPATQQPPQASPAGLYLLSSGYLGMFRRFLSDVPLLAEFPTQQDMPHYRFSTAEYTIAVGTSLIIFGDDSIPVHPILDSVRTDRYGNDTGRTHFYRHVSGVSTNIPISAWYRGDDFASFEFTEPGVYSYWVPGGWTRIFIVLSESEANSFVPPTQPAIANGEAWMRVSISIPGYPHRIRRTVTRQDFIALIDHSHIQVFPSQELMTVEEFFDSQSTTQRQARILEITPRADGLPPSFRPPFPDTATWTLPN